MGVSESCHRTAVAGYIVRRAEGEQWAGRAEATTVERPPTDFHAESIDAIHLQNQAVASARLMPWLLGSQTRLVGGIEQVKVPLVIGR